MIDLFCNTCKHPGQLSPWEVASNRNCHEAALGMFPHFTFT